MRSVRDVMNDRNGIAPGFGLLRHVLSLMILIEHCYIIALGKSFNIGYAKNDLTNQINHLNQKQMTIEFLRPLMFSLVGAFFILSGFLVFGSALRNRNLKDFFVLRVIRLVPALAVEVAISALIIGPIVTSYRLADYFTDSSFFVYFGNIIGLIHFDLPGVFKTNPTPNWVNANLWTLPAELESYIILGLALLIGLTADRRRFMSVLVAASAIILALYMLHMFSMRGSNVAYSTRYIVYLFFWGVAAYMFAEFIPLNIGLFVLSLLTYYVANILNIPDILSAAFLTYIVVYIGCCDFAWVDKSLAGDYSYGIYLYGYPLTQMVMFYLKDHVAGSGAALKVALLASIAVPLTCGVAFLSWHLIERRCLKLRRFLVKRAPSAAPAEQATA